MMDLSIEKVVFSSREPNLGSTRARSATAYG